MTKRKENAQSATGYDSENEIPEIKKQFIPIRDEAERGLCNSIAQEMERKFEESEESELFIETEHPNIFRADEDDEDASPFLQPSEESSDSDSEEMTYQEWLDNYLAEQDAKKAEQKEEPLSELNFDNEEIPQIKHTNSHLANLLIEEETALLQRSSSNSTQDLSDEDSTIHPGSPSNQFSFTPKENIIHPSSLSFQPFFNSSCLAHYNDDETKEPGIGTDFFTRYPELANTETTTTGETGHTPDCFDGLEQCLVS